MMQISVRLVCTYYRKPVQFSSQISLLFHFILKARPDSWRTSKRSAQEWLYFTFWLVCPLTGQQTAAEREDQAGGHHDQSGDVPQRELTETSGPSGAGTLSIQRSESWNIHTEYIPCKVMWLMCDCCFVICYLRSKLCITGCITSNLDLF